MMYDTHRRRVIALFLLLRRRRQRRRIWVRPFIKRRQEVGVFHRLVAELSLDRDRHLEFFRMSPEKMEHLLSLVGPDLTSQTTNFRDPVPPKQRLAVTLRFFATGEPFTSLAFQFGLGTSTVSNSVHTTCRVIERRMKDAQLPRPTQQMWRDIASTFWTKWNFPNCLGAIDGKHVNIKIPPKSGSLYLRKMYSILLLALVDADYRFVHIQVGDIGNDEIVYSGSDIGTGMEKKTLQVPADCPLPGSGEHGPMPFAMVGDAAFPLKTYLMRPFPGQQLGRWKKIFNYRLSRANMAAERAFGILAARWRVLYTHISMKPENAHAVIMAVCILHNYLLNPRDNQKWWDESERGGRLLDATNLGGNRGSRDAYDVREKLSAFFMSPEGSVSWQDKML